MIDRTPTKVLPNGAIRYGVYDDAGNFLRYEYIKPEDAPTQAGTPINKSTLASDAMLAMLGLAATATPDDAFKKLIALGNQYSYEVIYGSYTGDGQVSRLLNIGRSCIFAMIFGGTSGWVQSVKAEQFKNVIISRDLSAPVFSSSGIVSIGFYLEKDYENISGKMYHYFAFARKA